MTDDQLDALGEELLAAHRRTIEARHAYFLRADEDDPVLELVYVDAVEAQAKADFTHRAAVLVRSRFNTPDDETVKVAREYLAGLGYA